MIVKTEKELREKVPAFDFKNPIVDPIKLKKELIDAHRFRINKIFYNYDKNYDGKLSKKGKARMDIITSFFLIFYLVLLFFGSITSLIYTIETKQKLFTAWAPYVWPIKTLMLLGILLMLLQAFSTLFKDFAKMKEKNI